MSDKTETTDKDGPLAQGESACGKTHAQQQQQPSPYAEVLKRQQQMMLIGM